MGAASTAPPPSWAADHLLIPTPLSTGGRFNVWRLRTGSHPTLIAKHALTNLSRIKKQKSISLFQRFTRSAAFLNALCLLRKAAYVDFSQCFNRFYIDNAQAVEYDEYMNRIDSKTRAAVISALVEGCSIRSTVRMTGVSKPTVLKLLVEAGAVALKYQDEAFRNLTCKRIQVDELWAFIGAKQKNVTQKIAAKNPDAGDIWLWIAIDADTKIVPSWMLGGRDAGVASHFLYDLKKRLANARHPMFSVRKQNILNEKRSGDTLSDNAIARRP